MASENETVEDIVRELRDDANKVADEQHDEDRWTNLEAMQIYDSLACRIESAWRREKAELTNELEATRQQRNRARLDAQEKFMREKAELREVISRSPCGEIYQLGLVDDEGNDYCGCAVKFSEQENEKMPRVGHGDRFVVVPYSALAAIREEGGAK